MERYREEQGNLFNGVNTRDYSDALKLEIHKEIQNLENDKILNVPENEYVNYLIEKYIIECPEMQFNQYDVVPRPALVSSEILPNNFKYAAPEEVERNVYKLCVPFIGDGDILKIRLCRTESSRSGNRLVKCTVNPSIASYSTCKSVNIRKGSYVIYLLFKSVLKCSYLVGDNFYLVV